MAFANNLTCASGIGSPSSSTSLPRTTPWWSLCGGVAGGVAFAQETGLRAQLTCSRFLRLPCRSPADLAAAETASRLAVSPDQRSSLLIRWREYGNSVAEAAREGALRHRPRYPG